MISSCTTSASRVETKYSFSCIPVIETQCAQPEAAFAIMTSAGSGKGSGISLTIGERVGYRKSYCRSQFASKKIMYNFITPCFPDVK